MGIGKQLKIKVNNSADQSTDMSQKSKDRLHDPAFLLQHGIMQPILRLFGHVCSIDLYSGVLDHKKKFSTAVGVFERKRRTTLPEIRATLHLMIILPAEQNSPSFLPFSTPTKVGGAGDRFGDCFLW